LRSLRYSSAMMLTSRLQIWVTNARLSATTDIVHTPIIVSSTDLRKYLSCANFLRLCRPPSCYSRYGQSQIRQVRQGRQCGLCSLVGGAGGKSQVMVPDQYEEMLTVKILRWSRCLNCIRLSHSSLFMDLHFLKLKIKSNIACVMIQFVPILQLDPPTDLGRNTSF
jgi:hypothetical protein